MEDYRGFKIRIRPIDGGFSYSVYLPEEAVEPMMGLTYHAKDTYQDGDRARAAARAFVDAFIDVQKQLKEKR